MRKPTVKTADFISVTIVDADADACPGAMLDWQTLGDAATQDDAELAAVYARLRDDALAELYRRFDREPVAEFIDMNRGLLGLRHARPPVDSARASLARLLRHGDLPLSSMPADDRRRLVESGYAVEDLRFDGYVSISPRFAGGLDVSSATIVPATY